MDPLVVAGGLSEGVDPMLLDGQPIAGAKLGTGRSRERCRIREGLHMGSAPRYIFESRIN
jgi:hypothetical protein